MGYVVEKPSHSYGTPDGGSHTWRAPTVAIARPTDSLELRVTLPYGTADCELEIFNRDEMVVDGSRHRSIEEAQRFAVESTGIHDIEWSVAERERLTMRPEIGAESPLWTVEGEMVWLDTLPLNATLRHQLGSWASEAWERDDHGLRAEGQRLFHEVARQLGPVYEIVFDDQ